jgi:hypothetical protein
MHSAMQAAERILSFSDTIPAMDQQAFVAGFVELLSIYPQPVIERAMSPSRGLPAMVSYPNLAKYRDHLEVWSKEYWRERDLDERLNCKRLPEPPRDLEAEARIAKGMQELAEQLKRGMGPSTV